MIFSSTCESPVRPIYVIRKTDQEIQTIRTLTGKALLQISNYSHLKKRICIPA